MSFVIRGLAADAFRPLFALDDEALATRGMRRVVADADFGYPCRVSLSDAKAGERLLLLPYLHHDVAGPYRASGPIYVREAAQVPVVLRDEVPTALARRLLSLRAYDGEGVMRGAEVVEGHALPSAIEHMLADSRVDCLHVHNARPGCFAARVERG